MAKVEIKQPIVDEIKGYAADAKAAVLVDYRGIERSWCGIQSIQKHNACSCIRGN